MKTTNINERVSVILTEQGAKILNDYYKDLFHPIEEWYSTYKEGDPYVSELWDIMHIFGKYLSMGSDTLFKDNQLIFLYL